MTNDHTATGELIMSLSLADLEARMWPIKKAMDAAKAEGKLMEPLYFKGIMMIASEYAEAGYSEAALSEVCRIPPEYFKSHAKEQMRADPSFQTKAEAMFRVFQLAGYVPYEFPSIPMKPAKA